MLSAAAVLILHGSLIHVAVHAALNRECHPGDHYWDYYPCALYLGHCNSFEDRAPEDEIYGCPIFKWVAVTWLHDRVPGYHYQQWPTEDMPRWCKKNHNPFPSFFYLFLNTNPSTKWFTLVSLENLSDTYIKRPSCRSDNHHFSCIAPRRSDAYMRQLTMPSLVQIMACRLLGDNPLFELMMVKNQLRNIFQWNFTWNSKLFIQEHAYENAVCKNGGHLVSASMC